MQRFMRLTDFFSSRFAVIQSRLNHFLSGNFLVVLVLSRLAFATSINAAVNASLRFWLSVCVPPYFCCAMSRNFDCAVSPLRAFVKSLALSSDHLNLACNFSNTYSFISEKKKDRGLSFV